MELDNPTYGRIEPIMTNGKYFKLLCNSDLIRDPPKLAVNHPRTAPHTAGTIRVNLWIKYANLQT